MRAARTSCQEDVNTEIKMATEESKRSTREVEGGIEISFTLLSSIGDQPSRVIPLKTDLDQRRLAGRCGETLNKD